MYELIISGIPVAKSRPRAMVRKGKIQVYTPSKTKDFEYQIRKRAEQVFEQPLKTPVRIEVLFLMPRPKRIIWKTKPMPRIPCDKRPDASNLLKTVEDGLNGVAYLDDSQISTVLLSKKYHAGDEGPKTIIRIGQES